MPDLAELITTRKRDLGYSFRELEARGDHVFTSQRWNQLATGTRIKEFPEPTTLAAVAKALDVEVDRVVLAVAVTVGLAVRPAESDLAAMLPESARNLTTEQRHAVLAVIKAMNPPGAESTSSSDASPGRRARELAAGTDSEPGAADEGKFSQMVEDGHVSGKRTRRRRTSGGR